MAWLAQLTPSASYGAHVLPALVVLGVGMGATGAPAMFTATYNVPTANTGAVSSYVHTHTPSPRRIRRHEA